MSMKRRRDQNHYTISEHVPKRNRIGIDDGVNNQRHRPQRAPEAAQGLISTINSSSLRNPQIRPNPEPQRVIISLLTDDEDDQDIDDQHDEQEVVVDQASNFHPFDQSEFTRSASSSSQSESVSQPQSAPSDFTYKHDDKGYIVERPGVILLNKWQILRKLGQGTFSKVLECVESDEWFDSVQRVRRRRRRHKVAIKVIRRVYKYRIAAKTELGILLKIRENDADDVSNCIHLIEHGSFYQHTLFVFPLLGGSIYDFMVSNGMKPFIEQDVCHIVHQLLEAVRYIHSLNIICTDLKPENICLVSHEIDQTRNLGDNYLSPRCTQIKLIDFGSAVNVERDDQCLSHLIQTRHYRAPEVVLNLNWTYSADIWSVGTILIELIHGKMLFNTHCNIDHLNQMVECVGLPTSRLLGELDMETWTNYFDPVTRRPAMWKAQKSRDQARCIESYFGASRLCQQLLGLCRRLLSWDPLHRPTAQTALTYSIFHTQSHSQ